MAFDRIVAWGFVVWGIYYGILLMIEKLLWKPVFSRLPSFFMHLYTMFFVILGWGIFSWQDMADGTNYFKTLFGISGNFVNREAMYLLSSYLILLYTLYVALTVTKNGVFIFFGCLCALHI